MSSAHRRGRRARPPRPTTHMTASSLLPGWEGVPGFGSVGRALYAMTEMPPLSASEDGIDIVSAADVAAFQSLVALVQARPVYVGAEQLTVLPPLSDRGERSSTAAALRYASELQLPFDPLFLDFTGPGGEPCWIGAGKARCGLFGALLLRGSDAIPGALIDGGELAIFPFGAVAREAGGERRPWAHPRAAMPAQAALGALVVGGSRPQDGGELWLGESGFADHLGSRPEERMLALGATVAAELAFAQYEPTQPFATVARVHAGSGGNMLPLLKAFGRGRPGRRSFGELEAESRDAVTGAIGEAGLVLTLSLVALRAVFLLESANVELTQVPVTRQVRRAAERSEGQTRIALTVTVRMARRTRRKAPAGSGRDCAYAWERRGHYRHVTRGPHATPEHMRPCPREDEAHRASGGCCRREWVPPHVVGAGEGKPLIPKARRLAVDTGPDHTHDGGSSSAAS
jgi:hypothetical protein